MMARSRFLFATNPLSRTEGAWKKEKPRAYKLLPSLLPSIHLFLFSFLLSIHLSYFSASFNRIFHLSLLSSIRLSLFSYFPLSDFLYTSLYPPVLSFLLPSILLFLIPYFPLLPFHLSLLPFAFPNSLLPSIGLFLFPYFPQSTFPSFPIYFSLSAFLSFPLPYFHLPAFFSSLYILPSTRLSLSPLFLLPAFPIFPHICLMGPIQSIHIWITYGNVTSYTHGPRMGMVYVTLLTYTAIILCYNIVFID